MLIADCVCKLIINHNISKIVLSTVLYWLTINPICVYFVVTKKSGRKSNFFREEMVHNSIGKNWC